jgi:hypothetical protein
MKNLLGRMYPYFYIIITFHHSLLEFFSQMGQKKKHVDSWDNLTTEYPFLEHYESDISKINFNLSSHYHEYISKVSVGFVSTSLKASFFLSVAVNRLKPKRILDMGSGFSTYIFKSHTEIYADAEVYSIDESEFWLDKTREFLITKGLDTENLMTTQTFLEKNNLEFDLVYIDIGDYRERLKHLQQVLKYMLNLEGCVILDDFHIYAYRKGIKKICLDEGYKIFSLRTQTRSRLKYLALIKK